MPKKTSTIQDGNPLKLIGVLTPYIPSLLFKSGIAWLFFKRQANKGAKSFKKELLKQGVDEEIAALLTQQYIQGSYLLHIFRKFQ